MTDTADLMERLFWALSKRDAAAKEVDMEYEATFEVRVNRKLTDDQLEDLRNAMLKALDEAKLPFKADVVTGGINGPH